MPDSNKPEAPAKTPDTHTKGGAPTDAAHDEAGDGTLSGSIPAGLSADQLREIAASDKTDGTGTG